MWPMRVQSPSITPNTRSYMLEGFVSIPEYPEYYIHPSGRIFSTKSNKILLNRIGTHGYWYVKVSCEGKSKDLLIHRALCRVFKNLPSLDSKLEVDHDDTDKLNIDLDNLKVLSKADHLLKTLKDKGHVKREQNNCPVCGCAIEYRNKTCIKHKPKPDNISVEQIEYWVRNYSWVRAGKELGLSDNGLRKRYKSLSGKDPKNIKQL